MKSFKSYLKEGLSPSGMHKAIPLITSYLKKKIGSDMFAFPEAEEYSNSNGKGFGIRYFIPKGNRSFRINWSSPSSIGLIGISSLDVWLDSPKSYHVKMDVETSLAKTLPLIADILNGHVKTGQIRLSPESLSDLFSESTLPLMKYLVESAINPSEAFDGMLIKMKNPEFKKGDLGEWFPIGNKIFDEVALRFPKLLFKDGARYVWKGDKDDIEAIRRQKEHILDAIGATKALVSRGSEFETYKADPSVKHIEDNIERLSFEKQLEDLQNLINLTINGAANALFVAGRGGVGKTHTVEKVLHSRGLTDGNGYFKNTGSASAAGIYSLLFKHKSEIILFDDSDDALGDQEARNIFKAATDTKKNRKLVWNKMGKNIMDPDDITDEDIANGALPRYFEFTGKIIFISNLPMQKLDPDGAIRTRAYLIDIDPTDEEVYDFMEKICGDIPLQEGLKLSLPERKRVVNLLRNSKSKQSANLRKLSRGLNMAASGTHMSDAELSRMISTYA